MAEDAAKVGRADRRSEEIYTTTIRGSLDEKTFEEVVHRERPMDIEYQAEALKPETAVRRLGEDRPKDVSGAQRYLANLAENFVHDVLAIRSPRDQNASKATVAIDGKTGERYAIKVEASLAPDTSREEAENESLDTD